MAGGVERVLTLKANYFAEYFGYDITIILTEGKDKPTFYPLSNKVSIINLDINFEELWKCSFLKKIFVYLSKQRTFKAKLSSELYRLRPDFTISLLRREINFINSIKDGSIKIGELHVNRANYRNFEPEDSNLVKNLFAKFWMRNLVFHLKQLDRFVVLTEEDKTSWAVLDNLMVIPDPLSFSMDEVSNLSSKRVIAVGRYVYQKGFDLLLKAWAIVENRCPDWELVIFGQGDRRPYEHIIEDLKIDRKRCHLERPTEFIKKEYLNSSIFVFSSRFEGFGMVLIEAMSCGLPCVSFDCPCGPKDIITDGKDGILVDCGDFQQMADKLTNLINNPVAIKQMSEMALQKADQFSIDKISIKWRSMFDSLIQRSVDNVK
jgi:glycosyltransferase involved in cell wall biosynthesis